MDCVEVNALLVEELHEKLAKFHVVVDQKDRRSLLADHGGAGFHKQDQLNLQG